MSERTPEAAYRMLHGRVTGGTPASGDRSLSAAQYDAARTAYLDERGIVAKAGVAVWPPTSQTLMKRLGGGSWARAMEGLGLVANAGRSRGAGAFSDDDYTRAIREFLTAAGDDADDSVAGTSFAAYSAWAKASSVDASDDARADAGVEGDASVDTSVHGVASSGGAASDEASRAQARRRPSGAAMRQHFGSWEAAKNAGGEAMAGEVTAAGSVGDAQAAPNSPSGRP